MIQPIAAKWATELILSLFICFISKVQWCRCHSNSSCYNSVLKGATCCSCSSVQHINALLERGLRNSCRPLWRLASLGDMKWCNWMQLVDGRWWFGWWLDQRSSAFQKMEVRVRWESSIWTWPTKNHSLSLKLWFWFWYRRYRSLWRLRYQTVSNILIPGHETNIDKHISWLDYICCHHHADHAAKHWQRNWSEGKEGGLQDVWPLLRPTSIDFQSRNIWNIDRALPVKENLRCKGLASGLIRCFCSFEGLACGSFHILFEYDWICMNVYDTCQSHLWSS